MKGTIALNAKSDIIFWSVDQQLTDKLKEKAIKADFHK